VLFSSQAPLLPVLRAAFDDRLTLFSIHRVTLTAIAPVERDEGIHGRHVVVDLVDQRAEWRIVTAFVRAMAAEAIPRNLSHPFDAFVPDLRQERTQTHVGLACSLHVAAYAALGYSSALTVAGMTLTSATATNRLSRAAQLVSLMTSP